MFSVIAVVPRQNVSVLENGDKLQIVDASAAIQRHACKACGKPVPRAGLAGAIRRLRVGRD
ncbi:hypothetical protein ACVWYH_005265 [Bradyrhizobium sp. GM24.11]